MTRAALLVALLAVPMVARAGAWTRDEGHFYIGATYLRISTARYHGVDFHVIDIRPYTQHVVGLYGEVGLVSRWVTATVEGTLYRRNELTSQGYTEGIGDFRVGL